MEMLGDFFFLTSPDDGEQAKAYLYDRKVVLFVNRRGKTHGLFTTSPGWVGKYSIDLHGITNLQKALKSAGVDIPHSNLTLEQTMTSLEKLESLPFEFWSSLLSDKYMESDSG